MLIAFLLSAAAAASPAHLDQSLVAVLELKNQLPPSQRDAVSSAYLTDLVRGTVLAQGPSLRMITRENILVLLQAQGKTLDECEGECEVDTGRRLGADLVVTGELLQFGPELKLNLKLHDVHTSQLLSGTHASGTTLPELERQVRGAVADLFLPVLGAQRVSPPEASAWKRRAGWGVTGSLGAEAGQFSFNDNQAPNAARPSGTALGGRAELGFLYLSAPRPDRDESTFWGFHAGTGLAFRSLKGSPSGSTEARVLGQIGFVVGLGSFGSESAWRGVFLGVDYTPALQWEGPYSGVFEPFAFEAHIDFARLHLGDYFGTQVRAFVALEPESSAASTTAQRWAPVGVLSGGLALAFY